nr:MAG TPA: Integrase [Caudoviricetes sp.]
MGKNLKGKELGVGLTQRKDGLYQGRYKDRFGKQKTIYNSNLSEIRKELTIAIANNQLFTNVRDDITLDSWFERWVDVYKKKSVRPNTLREYTHIYNKNISPFLGNRNINSLIKSDIQFLIDKASDNNYKYERQSKIKVILTDMFSRAIEDELMIKNPAKGVKLRADKEVNAFALTINQQVEFFEACKGTFYDNMYNVAVNTGLRPGELFALTLEDIHMDEGYIDVNKTLVYQKYLDDAGKTFHVEPPKTKQSYRHVPINSVCRNYLIKQFELKKIVSTRRPKEQNEYLFVTRFNTPINSVIYSDSIRSIVRKINDTRSFDDEFPFFSGHTFRHTFATRCFEVGVQPKVVQAYLGHATLKMTMDLYTHVTEEKASDDIERIVKHKNNIVDITRKAI